jgi:hypothetical protein
MYKYKYEKYKKKYHNLKYGSNDYLTEEEVIDFKKIYSIYCPNKRFNFIEIIDECSIKKDIVYFNNNFYILINIVCMMIKTKLYIDNILNDINNLKNNKILQNCDNFYYFNNDITCKKKNDNIIHNSNVIIHKYEDVYCDEYYNKNDNYEKHKNDYYNYICNMTKLNINNDNIKKNINIFFNYFNKMLMFFIKKDNDKILKKTIINLFKIKYSHDYNIVFFSYNENKYTNINSDDKKVKNNVDNIFVNNINIINIINIIYNFSHIYYVNRDIFNDKNILSKKNDYYYMEEFNYYYNKNKINLSNKIKLINDFDFDNLYHQKKNITESLINNGNDEKKSMIIHI